MFRNCQIRWRYRLEAYLQILMKIVFRTDLLEGITPDVPQQAKVMLGLIEQERNLLQDPC